MKPDAEAQGNITRSMACVSVFVIDLFSGAFVFAAPPAVDACTVVTTTEIEQVIGKLKGAPMHGLDYVDLFIKKGAVTAKLSLKEAAGDEDKLKTPAATAAKRL